MDNELLRILNEINNNIIKLNQNWITPLFTLLGAIGGAFVVGYWQYMSTKQNSKSQFKIKELEIKCEIVSKQKQLWMNELRNECANFLTEYDVIMSNLQLNDLPKNEIDKMYKSASSHGNRIILMLDIENKEHENAIVALNDIQVLLEKRVTITTEQLLHEYDNLRSNLMHSLISIFRETLNKIKEVN